MKANYQIIELPQSGVQTTIEGNLLRILFDFKKAEVKTDDEKEAPNDIYDCESVDVNGRTYGEIVSAIINDRYNTDSVQAIMANYEDAKDESSPISEEKRQEYIYEYITYQVFRKHAKEIAKIAVEQI